MKKVVALILALSMVFALCGCGESATQEQISEEKTAPNAELTEEEPSLKEQLYDKYKDLIDKMEAEDYEGAIDVIISYVPSDYFQTTSEAEQEIMEVVITPENFLDYYDIVYGDATNEKDAFGNITRVDYGKNRYWFELKPEFRATVQYSYYQTDSIEIGVECDYELHHVDSIDWSTGEVFLSEEVYEDYMSQIVNAGWLKDTQTKIGGASSTETGIDFIGGANSYIAIYPFWSFSSGWTNGNHPSPDDSRDYYVFVPINITIVRAEGVLRIKQ